jgi:hypothetical protein
MSYQVKRMLVRYGNASAENLAALQAAYDVAVADVLAGKGSQVVSASTNGASFTFAQGAGTTTNAEWAACLDQVLEYISTETIPKYVSIARVC